MAEQNKQQSMNALLFGPLESDDSSLSQRLTEEYMVNPPFSFKSVMPCVRETVNKAKDVGSFVRVVSLIFAIAWKYYKLQIIISIAFAILASQLSVASPKYIKQLTDLFTERPSSLRQDFLWLLFLIGASKLASELVSNLSYRATFYMATQTEDGFRFASLWHYYSLPNDIVEQNDSGQIGTSPTHSPYRVLTTPAIGSRIEKGGSSIWLLLNNILGHDILPSFIALLTVQLSAFQAVPQVWWLFVLPVPFYLWLSSEHQQQVTVLMADSNATHDSAAQALYDGLSNIKVVKSFGKEQYETNRYASRWAAYHSLKYRMDMLDFRRMVLQNFIKIIGVSLLLYHCYDALNDGTITLGTLGMLMRCTQVLHFLEKSFRNAYPSTCTLY